MSRPPLELADVMRRHGDSFREAFAPVISSAQRRVMTAIASCRTAALGGHVDSCARCGFSAVSYNSCRNRHCPKCQAAARRSWLAERENELLPVPYFHVVFTLPRSIGEVALQNKRVIYDILFRSAAETLLTIGKDPKRLGASLGFLALLHTWGRNLLHHPHVHCVVPGGGLSPDRKRWVSSRARFLLPVRVLSRLFRRLFLSRLKAAFEKNQLRLFGSLSALADPGAFAGLLQEARSLDWVVYSKPPFGGPSQVLRYLARYTHRVAISNSRLVALDEKSVTFRFKDYKDGDRQKLMQLDAHEFLRRFLLHVLPDRFVRIRHFGFLANRHRASKLALCRLLLGVSPPTLPASSPLHAPLEPVPPSPSGATCPSCHQATLHRHRLAPLTGPSPSHHAILQAAAALDSS